MPKLYLSIHIDQNGQQTIHSEGDPALWPLVGRLAACHPQAFAVRWSGETMPSSISGESAETDSSRWAMIDQERRRQGREHKVNTALVTLGWKGGGDLQAWAEMQRARLSEHATLCDLLATHIVKLKVPGTPALSIVGAVRNLLEDVAIGEVHDAALADLNTAAAPIRDRLRLADSTPPLETFNQLAVVCESTLAAAKTFEGQVDSIDAVLRPLVIAAEEDSPEEVADLVAARIRGAEECSGGRAPT